LKAKESSHLSIVLKNVDQLRAFSSNARKHAKPQIRQIADSIRAFGFTNPILIDSNNRIIAGHGRWEASKLLGLMEVPTILLENLTEDQIRAYVIADNKIAENAGWDHEILAIELQHLSSIECVDLDVSITGFEISEIDLIIEEAKGAPKEDPVPEPDLEHDPVTASGDIWQLGKHRIACGNSLEDSTFRTLMRDRRAAAVIADPPYNVRIDGHATGNGSVHHREFAMASGEMTDSEFGSFLNNCLRLLAKHSASGSVHFIFIDWRHLASLIAAGEQNYDELLNLCVWVKNNGGMGSFYRSQHEVVLVFRNGRSHHRNNIQLGKFGRNRTNVWSYPGVQTLSKRGDEGNLLALHPTVKPVAMVADAMLDCTARGEIVLDPFLGSGTTLLAAERVGRICYGIEIDPYYVDVAIRRWQRHTGQLAIHVGTGKSFDEISATKEVERER
jgi:DNA modification methylase